MGRRESPSRTQQAASPITWTILDLQRQQRCQATARPPRGAPGPEITAGGAGLAPSARGELDFSPGIGGRMRDQRPAGMSLCVPATSATRGDIPAAPGALVEVGGHTRGHKAPAPPPPGAPSRPSAPLRRLGGFLKQLGAAISGKVGRSHSWHGHNRGLAPATITQLPPQPSPGAHHNHRSPFGCQTGRAEAAGTQPAPPNPKSRSATTWPTSLDQTPAPPHSQLHPGICCSLGFPDPCPAPDRDLGTPRPLGDTRSPPRASPAAPN